MLQSRRINFPNTTILTRTHDHFHRNPSVWAPGYTLREWEFTLFSWISFSRILIGIVVNREINVQEIDVDPKKYSTQLYFTPYNTTSYNNNTSHNNTSHNATNQQRKPWHHTTWVPIKSSLRARAVHNVSWPMLWSAITQDIKFLF